MASNDQASDVATYAASVRAALSDLPSDQAAVLLEDLEDHLREIAAETGGTLTERLGPPEKYAQELRTAYGATSSPSPRRPDPAFRDVRRAVAWVTSSAWYREVRLFLPELRPAWWVLRGYLSALILTAAFSRDYPLGPIPNPATKRGLAEILAAGVAIWLSVRIGRRSRSLPQGARVLAISANVLVAFVALAVLGNMHTFAYSELIGTATPEQAPFNAAYAAGPLTNIYPYSQDGKPLTNVLLYDQDGRPITVEQSEAQTTYPIGADGRAITNAYPLTQRHMNGDPAVAPRVAFPPWPTPSPAASPSATSSPTASPSTSH
jgi:HAAS